MQIDKFKNIAKQYQCIFFDAYGVLKNHAGILDGVPQLFQWLDDNNIRYYIITNDSSKPAKYIAQSYQEDNIPHITTEKVISSAMMAAEYMASHFPKGANIAYLGKTVAEEFITGNGFKPHKLEELPVHMYPDMQALCFFEDSGFDFKTGLNASLNLIRSTELPVIAANQDLIYPCGNNQSALTIGSIANMLEPATEQTFLRFGKPDRAIFEFAYNIANKHQAIEKKEILMVGDTLATDIIGANQFGIDSLLTLSGSTSPHKAEELMQKKNIYPTHLCTSIID